MNITTSTNISNFNVAMDNWIPVSDKDNVISKVSPIEIFSNNKLINIAGSAIQNYNIIKFLCCIAQSCKENQFNDYESWLESKDTYTTSVCKYLHDNKDLFWMNGERPFLQFNFDNTDDIKWDNIKLSEQYATGNNPLLKTSQITSYLTYADVISDLLVHQMFSPTFGLRKAIPSRFAVYGKSIDGNLNVYVSGKYIIDTIWMNLCYMPTGGFGVPVWDKTFDQSTTTYLSKLVPISAHIKLSDDLTKMKYDKGLEYTDFLHLNTDMYLIKSTYTIGKNLVERPLRTKPDMLFWRDFASVSTSNLPPQLDERLSIYDDITINTIGANYKGSMGVFSTISVSTSSTNIQQPSKLHDDVFRGYYINCVDYTTKIYNYLEKTICIVSKPSKTGTKLISKSKKLLRENKLSITKLYWSRVDQYSDTIFKSNGSDDDYQRWISNVDYVIQNDIISHIQSIYGYVIAYEFKEVYFRLTFDKK